MIPVIFCTCIEKILNDCFQEVLEYVDSEVLMTTMVQAYQDMQVGAIRFHGVPEKQHIYALCVCSVLLLYVDVHMSLN